MNPSTEIEKSVSFTDLVTIAMPVYERTNYFREALDSALNQTVKCEIIVVDNCSSHHFFEEVCKEKKVTYYRNETNIGLYNNLNKCYSLAKTEYVKFLQDDDILSPNYIHSFLKAKNQYPDIDIFFSNYTIISTKGKVPHHYTIPFGYMANGYKVIEYAANYELNFPYMTSTIKKGLAPLDLDTNESFGGYDWLWIYSNADRFSFYGDPEKLYLYRIHMEKASDRKKDWVANRLTHSYIIDNIIPLKITDPKLIKKASKKVFWELMILKSFGNKKEIQKIQTSESRFGKYLKNKQKKHYFFKMLFLMPKGLICFFFRVSRKLGIVN